MAQPGQWETTFGAQCAMFSSLAPPTMLLDFYGIFRKNLWLSYKKGHSHVPFPYKVQGANVPGGGFSKYYNGSSLVVPD